MFFLESQQKLISVYTYLARVPLFPSVMFSATKLENYIESLPWAEKKHAFQIQSSQRAN